MQKNQTPEQILESVRGEQEMTKGEFAEALGISRQWYDQILNGRTIDLKTLCYLSVDYSGEWRGDLANRLITAIHGPQMVPIGEKKELQKFREVLRSCNYEDLSGMATALVKGQFPLWASELQVRFKEHLAKAEMRAEVNE